MPCIKRFHPVPRLHPSSWNTKRTPSNGSAQRWVCVRSIGSATSWLRSGGAGEAQGRRVAYECRTCHSWYALNTCRCLSRLGRFFRRNALSWSPSGHAAEKDVRVEMKRRETTQGLTVVKVTVDGEAYFDPQKDVQAFLLFCVPLFKLKRKIKNGLNNYFLEFFRWVLWHSPSIVCFTSSSPFSLIVFVLVPGHAPALVVAFLSLTSWSWSSCYMSSH